MIATPPMEAKAAKSVRSGPPSETWRRTTPRERVRVLRRARNLAADRANALAALSAELRGRPPAETLSAEVLPLLDGIRFLERNLEALLAPHPLGKSGRPFWLANVTSTIAREPLGTVLVIGPANYPLFLPGIQALQALAAGNSVLMKPAPGCTAPMRCLREILLAAGLPEDALTLLSEATATALQAIRTGVQKVVLTGSAESGRAVLRACAETLTPAVVELSGCDAMIVRADADLPMAADAVVFGLRLNGSETCLAPRRIFVQRGVAERFEALLATRLTALPAARQSSEISARLHPLVTEALAHDAHLLGMAADALPLVLSACPPDAAILREEIFAPVAAIAFYDDEASLPAMLRPCAFALGATIFSGNEEAAEILARELNAGVVCINDLIVPTADPRLPFGGRGASGYGVTRGSAGLLEMTQPKVVTRTRGSWRPHFAALRDSDGELFHSYIQTAHGGSWRGRWSALLRLLSALRKAGPSHQAP